MSSWEHFSWGKIFWANKSHFSDEERSDFMFEFYTYLQSIKKKTDAHFKTIGDNMKSVHRGINTDDLTIQASTNF